MMKAIKRLGVCTRCVHDSSNYLVLSHEAASQCSQAFVFIEAFTKDDFASLAGAVSVEC
jgi:hypothetical protein